MSETTNPIESADNIVNNPIGEISEKNLISKIWFNPKKTLSFVLANFPNKNITLYFVLASFANSIDEDNFSSGISSSSLVISIVGGTLFGWAFYLIYAWLLSVAGGWMSGRASMNQYKTVLAWSLVPQVFSLVFVLIKVIIILIGIFTNAFEGIELFALISALIFELLIVVLGIWSFVILVNGIMLIQNFGRWKAFLNAIVPGFMILIPILLLILFFMT
jgi:hypothetical protein